MLIESAQDRPSDATFTYNLGDLYAESGQTLQGSFSAVSKQASKQARSSSPSRRKRKEMLKEKENDFLTKHLRLENGAKECIG